MSTERILPLYYTIDGRRSFLYFLNSVISSCWIVMPQFTFFTGPKPWETELIVVTTCVGPINVSSPAFVFAHIPGAESGTTTTDRKWSSPSCIYSSPRPRALTVCRKNFTELTTIKILYIKWNIMVVCSDKKYWLNKQKYWMKEWREPIRIFLYLVLIGLRYALVWIFKYVGHVSYFLVY